MKRRKPTHPGIVFHQDVILPKKITISQVARELGVSRKTMSEIINGRCRLSVVMACKIGNYTKTSSISWLEMQNKLDLWKLENGEYK